MSQHHPSPSPVDLPFNRASLDTDFQLATPDQDPGGEGVWLPLQGQNLITMTTDQGATLPEGENFSLAPMSLPLYIGQWQGRPCRLLHIDNRVELPPQLQAQSLRATVENLPVAILSLAGVGQMILHWEQCSSHCGDCGEPMVRLPKQWGKACPSCRKHHFPRIHPCVIGLVVKGDEILLAHKGEWVDGRYSLVAGFVEFGECLEEAMARETLEETNIKIKNIRYIGSQSWPFPSQLMCGFVADYAGGEIALNDKELADAKWFRLDQLPTLPPSRSIARHLIDRAAEFLR
ncbi:NAD+ diphosphatase [Desulfuromusa kysingii]|uniref:NAD(+) diphosphatase n=1 Tax=Desulfuromusa kysingii TaxID=37625 RepID=A0A1H3W939_9BACT|nr:NAD(+) diphosphatase [Desulfuromusa kysingii]SDZ82862.1 NAD+ diphosphatase [Desulfuromusa kysingii]